MNKIILMSLFVFTLFAEEEEGNFSLPSSQQPYGLFAFGGNVIDKGESQLFIFGDDFVGKNKVVTDVIPSYLYGVTDKLSILFNFPFSPELIDGCHKSAGIQDFYIQLEYAFYNEKSKDCQDQATFVLNATAPTGSITKDPATGYGGPSAFIGATFTRMCPEWFFFTGQGAILTTKKHNKRAGSMFLSQFGFGKSFCSPEGWIYAWMVEADGQYQEKREPSTGGTAIYITPSLWVSSKDVLLQFGVSLPVHQNLFGRQRKFDYALNFNLGLSFY